MGHKPQKERVHVLCAVLHPGIIRPFLLALAGHSMKKSKGGVYYGILKIESLTFFWVFEPHEYGLAITQEKGLTVKKTDRSTFFTSLVTHC